jgi:hypothetical protein
VTTLTEIEAAADALPKGQKEQLLAFLAAKLGANWTLLIRHLVPCGVRVSTPELGRWRKTLMRRYWMSSGSAATREASPRYARIHLVGRRPIEAI